MPSLFSTIHNHIPLEPYAFEGEPVACNLCGSTHSLTISKADRRLKPLRTVACEQCGLIRTDPMPTEAELEAYYAGEYRLDYQFSLFRRPPRFHLNRSRREAEARWHTLKPAVSGRLRVLDFGSGSGEFLALAAKEGHDVQGIEPDSTFAAHAREAYHVPVEACTWQKACFEEASFDIITANHVLEHLREPVSALKQIASWLAPGGILYVSVPNALTRRENSFQQFHFAHVYNFTPQALIWAGMLAGLEPDPRFENINTTIIFRKKNGAIEQPNWGAGEGRRIAAHFKEESPIGFLLSGRWILDALRRMRKVWRDSSAAA
jgi:SAM-dependent methyltransferase